MHVQVTWLDRQRGLDLQLVVGIMGPEVEVLEELLSVQHKNGLAYRSHDQEGLLPCEWSSDTATHTVAEWLPSIRR
jgi:hypothetical protein